MNLYEVMIEHYAPKDSKKGVYAYLIANSDEQVYEWLKNDSELKDGRCLYLAWGDIEEDGETFEIYDKNYNVVNTETFKERMIRLRGNANDEDVELTDLYYGRTLVGWKLVKEDIKNTECCMLLNSGIAVESIV